MKPYYHDEQSGITIWNCDCREVLPSLGKADCAITDPPYGVNIGGDNVGGNLSLRCGHGLKKGQYLGYEDTYENYCLLVPGVMKFLVENGLRVACFIGPHIHELPKPAAIGGVYVPSAAGRHSWGFKNFLPVLLYGAAPDLNLGAKTPTAIRSNETVEQNGHPCPKPISWMQWLVKLTSREGETILDPFMGSGTTLVAAKSLGRKCIGIEIVERYAEIAAKRLEQNYLQFTE